MTKFLKYFFGPIFYITLFALHQLPYLNLVFRTDVVLTLYFVFLAWFCRFKSGKIFLGGFIFLLISFAMTILNNSGPAGQMANSGYFISIFGCLAWLWEDTKTGKMVLINKNDLKQISSFISLLIPPAVLTILVLVPRLVLAVNLFGTSDSLNAINMTNVFLQGKDAYTTGNYTYPPLWLNILALLKFVSLDFNIPYYVLLRLPAIFSDLLITCLIYTVLNGQYHNYKASIIPALLYALNPVVILISGYHGQIDSIWILCSLMSWYIFEFYPKSYKNIIISSFLISIGIALKVFPILFVPLFLMKVKGKKNQLIFAALAVLPFVITMIGPFLTSFNYVFRGFVNYGIEHNFWGISAVAAFIYYHFPADKSVYYLYRILTTAQIERLPLYGFLAFLYVFLYVYRKQFTIISGMFLIMTGVLIMTPFISVQWWIWPIPFAIMSGSTNKYFWYYTIPITLVLISRYFLYLLNIPPEFRPSFINVRETIKGIKIDSVNKIIAFGVWLMLWKWLAERMRKIIELP